MHSFKKSVAFMTLLFIVASSRGMTQIPRGWWTQY